MKHTLRKKILGGYGIALFLVVVVLIWAIIHLVRLGKASNAILKENYHSILAAENMINNIERQDSATLLLVLGYHDEGLTQFYENESEFLQWLARAKDNITIQGEEKIVSNIEQGYASYLTYFVDLRMIHLKERVLANSYYHETILPKFKCVRDECIHLREINEQTMFKASTRAEDIANRALWSMSIVGAIAIILGLGFSLMLSQFLVQPLRKIQEAAHKIADGSYDVEITTKTSDELGRLVKEFNYMARKLKSYHDLNIGKIVAEKKRSEAILQSIDDGVIVVDENFMITGINRAALKIFNIEGEHIAQNKHFLEIINNEPLFNHIKNTIETKKPPKIGDDQNFFSIKRENTDYYYQFSITPMRSENGDLNGVILLLLNITKLKLVDRLKSEFVMAASHELRTPLTSIEMSIELLFEKGFKKLTPVEKQLLSVIHEETKRLKALVNDLLDLSRIEAGKMEMEFDKVAVNALFEKAITVLKPQAEEKSIELSARIAEGVSSIKADFNKVTWILTNLISNALRYTNHNGHIWLYSEQIGQQVHISVSDDGKGIPYEYQSKIFEKFIQVKGDDHPGGSGLGLAICKEIVRAHGGTIWADSTPGEGSTFTFTIPLA